MRLSHVLNFFLRSSTFDYGGSGLVIWLQLLNKELKHYFTKSQKWYSFHLARSEIKTSFFLWFFSNMAAGPLGVLDLEWLKLKLLNLSRKMERNLVFFTRLLKAKCILFLSHNHIDGLDRHLKPFFAVNHPLRVVLENSVGWLAQWWSSLMTTWLQVAKMGTSSRRENMVKSFDFQHRGRTVSRVTITELLVVCWVTETGLILVGKWWQRFATQRKPVLVFFPDIYSYFWALLDSQI